MRGKQGDLTTNHLLTLGAYIACHKICQSGDLDTENQIATIDFEWVST